MVNIFTTCLKFSLNAYNNFWRDFCSSTNGKSQEEGAEFAEIRLELIRGRTRLQVPLFVKFYFLFCFLMLVPLSWLSTMKFTQNDFKNWHCLIEFIGTLDLWYVKWLPYNRIWFIHQIFSLYFARSMIYSSNLLTLLCKIYDLFFKSSHSTLQDLWFILHLFWPYSTRSMIY